MRQANDKALPVAQEVAQFAQDAKPVELKPEAVKPLEAKPIEAKPAEPFIGQVPVAQGPPEKKAAPPLDITEFLVPALWLVGALLLGALVFWFFARWRRRTERRDTVSEQLTRFRASYEQGEMTEEEYKRVHTLLAGKMQDQITPAAPPPKKQKPSSDGPANS